MFFEKPAPLPRPFSSFLDFFPRWTLGRAGAPQGTDIFEYRVSCRLGRSGRASQLVLMYGVVCSVSSIERGRTDAGTNKCWRRPKHAGVGVLPDRGNFLMAWLFAAGRRSRGCSSRMPLFGRLCSGRSARFGYGSGQLNVHPVSTAYRILPCETLSYGTLSCEILSVGYSPVAYSPMVCSPMVCSPVGCSPVGRQPGRAAGYGGVDSDETALLPGHE